MSPVERRRYESPLSTAMIVVIPALGLVATILDPTSLVGLDGQSIQGGPISDLNLAFLYIGIGMFILGVIIRFVAIGTLRRNFSSLLRIREGHTLTKNGIYQWIRHPAYLGVILLYLGIPVMVSSLLGFMVMFLLVPYLLYRIKLEEKMLIGRFGAEYEEYMRHTKKLIPFIY